MSDFYNDMALTAQDLLSEFGRAMTLRRASAGSYNAALDSHVGGSSVDIPVMAIVTKYKETEIDGEIIQRGDVRILIADIKPDKNNIIISDAESFTVIDIETLQPGDVALLYKVQARSRK